MSPRTGRPKAENPKNYSVKIRFDEAGHRELMQYSQEHGITRTEVIRKAVKLLLSQEK